MQVGHVVAAVEVVVDEHLPVAVEDVVLAVEPVQVRQARAPRTCAITSGPRNSSSDGPSAASRTNTQFSQTARGDRHQRVRRRIEVAHALEGGRGLERALERVGPAVVGAAQPLHAARGLGQHRGGVVPADVEEAAQHAVAAAHHQQRLARQFERDELHRVRAPGRAGRRTATCSRTWSCVLELEDARVHVPRRPGQVLASSSGRSRLVAVDQVEDGCFMPGRSRRPSRPRPRGAQPAQNSWVNFRPMVRGWFGQ